MLTIAKRTTTLFACIAAIALSTMISSTANAQLKIPKIKLPKPKIDLNKLKPSIKFRPYARLSKGTVRLSLYADVSVAGKRFRLTVFSMSVRKSKKSIRVQRKVGKLSVSLRISWAGSRALTISGTARYLKFKVPVPRLTVRF